MNERTYLDRQQSRLNRRIRLRSSHVGRDLERAVAPVMREHPRKGLAAGAAAGALLGAALAPRPTPTGNNGVVRSTFGFLKGVLAYAARVKLAKTIVDDVDEDTADRRPTTRS